MKPNRNVLRASLLAAGALLAATTGISAASAAASAADDAAATTDTPPPAHAGRGWHGHDGPWHLLSKLGLSAAQQASIKTIMTNAHPQMQSLHEQMHANSLKLRQTAPSDANYSSIAAQVSQTHGSLAAQLMAEQADVRAQIYKVLTPAQQTQLTALEAEMEARHAAHGPGRGGPPPEG